MLTIHYFASSALQDHVDGNNRRGGVSREVVRKNGASRDEDADAEDVAREARMKQVSSSARGR